MFRLEKGGVPQQGIEEIIRLLNNPPFPNLSPDKKTDLLKKELLKINFPHITQKNKIAQKICREFSADGIRIHFDPNFEKNDLTLSFQMNAIEDLSQLQTKLDDEKNINNILQLLQLLKKG